MNKLNSLNLKLLSVLFHGVNYKAILLPHKVCDTAMNLYSIGYDQTTFSSPLVNTIKMRETTFPLEIMRCRPENKRSTMNSKLDERSETRQLPQLRSSRVCVLRGTQSPAAAAASAPRAPRRVQE